MTLPPAMVAGTGELVGPVQKPAGSGEGLEFGADGAVGSAARAGAAARARICVRASICVRARARIATALSPRGGAVIPRDCITAPWHREAVIEGGVFAVANDDLHLTLRLWHEAEGDDRVCAHRDIGIEVE